jgi:hypothetical protein
MLSYDMQVNSIWEISRSLSGFGWRSPIGREPIMKRDRSREKHYIFTTVILIKFFYNFETENSASGY